MASEDGREGLSEVLDTFLPTQSADVADEGGARGQGGGDGEGGEIEEVLMGNEDFVAVGFKVPFGDEGGGINDDLFAVSAGNFSEYLDGND